MDDETLEQDDFDDVTADESEPPPVDEYRLSTRQAPDGGRVVVSEGD